MTIKGFQKPEELTGHKTDTWVRDQIWMTLSEIKRVCAGNVLYNKFYNPSKYVEPEAPAPVEKEAVKEEIKKEIQIEQKKEEIKKLPEPEKQEIKKIAESNLTPEEKKIEIEKIIEKTPAAAPGFDIMKYKIPLIIGAAAIGIYLFMKKK
jgi:hypothetical protein